MAARFASRAVSAGRALGPVAAGGGYAVGAGCEFLSQIGGNVDEEGGIWHADAVYSVSPDLPAAGRVIEAKQAVARCAEQGRPTV